MNADRSLGTSRPDERDALVAYFSMEVALDDALPTYSGGLGVLAGDLLRSAADLGLPLVGVSLVYHDGYFHQELHEGHQVELPVSWSPEKLLERLEATVTVDISGRVVTVGAWRYTIEGAGGARVPVLLLDTDLAVNDERDRTITDQLYGGDDEHRLRQEAVLGIGGVRMLAAAGYRVPTRWHMNEGHSSLLTVELVGQAEGDGPLGEGRLAELRARCAFTTHTPVPAGHDRFADALVRRVLGQGLLERVGALGALEDGVLDMTTLGMRLSAYVNGVSLRHGELSREMFPGVEIASVTNGVHAATWAAPSTKAMLDRHCPGWRIDNARLRDARAIPLEVIADTHRANKEMLLDTVRQRAGIALDPSALTIGIARRATPYKQSALLFSDLARLRAIAAQCGPLQVVCSGKAHPRDEEGKALIAEIVAAGESLAGSVAVVFLEDYSLELAARLCAGTDVWLNTPIKPLEASGTSGMKAALNGVPSLSTLDGWWIEGCLEGVTGWAVGGEEPGDDAEALYDKLGSVVAPLFHRDPSGFLAVERDAIALNGSHFNTERMVHEYALDAYGLNPGAR